MRYEAGMVQELPDGSKIIYGELKLTYTEDGERVVCRLDQDYKVVAPPCGWVNLPPGAPK